MELWQALLLGAVQGITEFLPVSSSGHLVMGAEILGVERRQDVLFEVLVHLGTLVAVVWVYRGTLENILRQAMRAITHRTSRTWDGRPMEHLRLLGFVVVGSVPTAAIGLLFKDDFEALFQSVPAVAACFALTGVALLLTRWAPRGKVESGHIGVGAALLIGVIQGLAIAPGISRSGTTIACALFLGIERSHASQFSFLLFLPAIAGATLLQARELESIPWDDLGVYLAAAVTAALVGLACLRWLIHLVDRGRLYLFAGYLLPLAVLLWAWSSGPLA